MLAPRQVQDETSRLIEKLASLVRKYNEQRDPESPGAFLTLSIEVGVGNAATKTNLEIKP